MHFIGYKHGLITKVKGIVEQAVFIHNRVFLEYEGEEKKEALEKLEIIVKALDISLEKYKINSITTEEMKEKYITHKQEYEDVFQEYLWINKFNLYDGYKPEYPAF